MNSRFAKKFVPIHIIIYRHITGVRKINIIDNDIGSIIDFHWLLWFDKQLIPLKSFRQFFGKCPIADAFFYYKTADVLRIEGDHIFKQLHQFLGKLFSKYFQRIRNIFDTTKFYKTDLHAQLVFMCFLMIIGSDAFMNNCILITENIIAIINRYA